MPLAVTIVLVLLVATGLAAEEIRVETREMEALRAETARVTARFEVIATGSGEPVQPIAVGMPAVAAPLPCPDPAVCSRPTVCAWECDAELTEALLPIWSRSAPGNWSYSVTLRERDAESVASGRFAVSLLLDGVLSGEVRVAQNLSDPQLREGVRAIYVLDAAPADAVAITVILSPILDAGDLFVLAAFRDTDVNYKWRGVGGSFDGETNPALDGREGHPVTIRIEYDDITGGTHNLQIRQGSSVMAGPTTNIDSQHQTATLEWPDPVAGTYRYECQYHGATQFGLLRVDPPE